MIWIIESIRSAPFLEKAVKFLGENMDDDAVRNTQKPEPYFGKLLPNTIQKRGAYFSSGRNAFVFDHNYLPLEPKEGVARVSLKELLPLCGLHDDKGNQIEKIMFNYEGCPFMTHKDMKVVLDNGKAVLDDDNPKNKILIASFLLDPEFKVTGKDTDRSFSAFHKYIIGQQEFIERQEVKEIEAEMNLAGLLKDMDRSRLLTLCRIWDLVPNKGAGDPKIRAEIYTHMKRTTLLMGKEKRSDWFVKFAEMNDADLAVWDLFVSGRAARAITRGRDEHFEFQGQSLGTTEQDAVAFLGRPTNDPVVKDIKAFIKARQKVGKIDAVNLIE